MWVCAHACTPTNTHTHSLCLSVCLSPPPSLSFYKEKKGKRHKNKKKYQTKSRGLVGTWLKRFQGTDTGGPVLQRFRDSAEEQTPAKSQFLPLKQNTLDWCANSSICFCQTWRLEVHGRGAKGFRCLRAFSLECSRSRCVFEIPLLRRMLIWMPLSSWPHPLPKSPPQNSIIPGYQSLKYRW